MQESIVISTAALRLLRACAAGEKPDVEENRKEYRELVAVGLMVPLNTFYGGEESAYRLTEASIIFSSPPASPAESASRGG